METKIKNVMSSIFDVELDQINDTTTQGDLENWDSMGHMNLVVALEEEFGLVFDEEEIIEMMNFKLICLIVSEKLD